LTFANQEAAVSSFVSAFNAELSVDDDDEPDALAGRRVATQYRPEAKLRYFGRGSRPALAEGGRAYKTWKELLELKER
jgi:hypothetical protein